VTVAETDIRWCKGANI